MMLTTVFLLFALFVAIFAGIPGGETQVDSPNSNPRIVSAAQFAASQMFPEEAMGLRILEAYKQVVAGMNYRMTVEVTRMTSGCATYNFVVYDKFGSLSLTTSERVSDSCQ